MVMMAALRRGLIWTLLVVALVAVVTATAVDRLRRPEPPPVFDPVPAFSLTNRDGRAVRLQDLKGKPWIADFVFTRCPASCPLMTARMAKLNRELPDDVDVRLVSFSVDPEHDTPQVLQRYAESYKAPARWLFLTGGKDEIYRLSRQGFKLGIDIPPPPAPGAPAPEPILHSTRFVLVDGQGRIRGYYDGFDEESMKKLVRDLEAVE
jgi:cytochrome oxidase Cu insertion factor (SCO1/SenC/PrrC family)